MRKKIVICFIAFLIILITLSACLSSPTPPPPSEEQLHTAAAETIIAQLTLDAGATAVAQLTQISSGIPSATPPPPPTNTAPPVLPTDTPPPSPIPPTFTPPPPPTNTPLPPPTNTPPPTPTPFPCDWVQFIGDISVPDGTDFAPGTQFTKTWRLKNIGNCTWTNAYNLVFVSGSQMSGPSAQPLQGNIPPNGTVDLSVNLIAPANQGSYTGNWAPRNPSGVLFGMGPQQNQSFWVKIDVIAATKTVFDFSQNACLANWRSAVSSLLLCPGQDPGAPEGYITVTYSPKLETGATDDEATIITVPNQGGGGYISGEFPAIQIRNGDRFKTVIGCYFGAAGCDVSFQLNYIADNGPLQTFARWDERYDGSTQNIDLDLSTLSGRNVRFFLTVTNNNDATDDLGFWLLPRIVGFR